MGKVILCTGDGGLKLLAVRPEGSGDMTKTTSTGRAAKQRAVAVVADPGGRPAVSGQRERHASCVDAKTGSRSLAGAAGRRILGVAGLCRRPALLLRRRRARPRLASRAGRGRNWRSTSSTTAAWRRRPWQARRCSSAPRRTCIGSKRKTESQVVLRAGSIRRDPTGERSPVGSRQNGLRQPHSRIPSIPSFHQKLDGVRFALR